MPQTDDTPGRPRLYYGWVVLIVAAVAMTATLPGRTHGLGLISKPLMADLGISEVTYTLVNSWAVVLGAAFCLPVGRLIDRVGARGVLAGVAAALGAAVLLMAHVSTVLWLAVTLTLVRGLGQGALSVVSMAMVGKWFTRRLGLAMAVFTVLLSMGFIASTLGVGGAVGQFGWRNTWAGVGVACLALAAVGWLIVRSTPESIGQKPDAPAEETAASTDLPLATALRSPAFWAFTASAALFNFVWSAITLLSEPLTADRGLGHDTYVAMMGMMVAGGLPANLLCGWLAPKVGLGRLQLAGMTALAAAVAAYPHLTTEAHALVYGLVLGAAGGVVTVVFFTVNGELFGRRHLGAIQGTAQLVSVLASAAGPLALATVRERTGASDVFFDACAPAAVALGLAAWLAPRPGR